MAYIISTTHVGQITLDEDFYESQTIYFAFSVIFVPNLFCFLCSWNACYFAFLALGVQNLFCFLRDWSEKTGMPFNLYNEYISELVTYGILKTGEDGFCEIANPIHQYCIVQTFQPLINGLERQYLPEDTDAGFRIQQVPNTPQEFVGQY
jgi:hypothetical protein